MSIIRSPLFWLILLAYLAAGVLYAVLTPAWQAPDEPAHYNYVRYLARKSGFPELVSSCYNQAYLNKLTSRRFPPDLPLDQVCYEFYQPPLYYLLATPVFVLGRGSLLGLRLFSVCLGAGVIALAFGLARTLFPDRPTIAYGTMAFVAFIPMHVAVLASVNNDALAELVVAALLLLLVRRLLADSPATLQSDLLLGLLLGLGLVTKLTVYVLGIPLVAATLWLKRTGPGWRTLLRPGAVVYGLALLIALPWYIRNALLYGGGDILGLARHDRVVVGQLRTVDFIAQTGWGNYLARFLTTTFHSFWGQFGWMAVPMDGRTYLALALLTLLAAAGLLAFFSRFGRPEIGLSPRQRRALGLLGLAVLLMGVAYIGYNVTLVQFQARYLFPALAPLGLFFSLGLSEIFARSRGWWLVASLALALIGLLGLSLRPGGTADKWSLLVVGLLLVLAAGRAWLARAWPAPVAWLMAACYLGLGLLTALSPFWFIVPYLSP